MEVAAQLSLHFPYEKCHLEEHKKTMSIFNTIQPIFIKFSPK